MNQSNLRIISIGIVAIDKTIDSQYIEVYPIEMLPFLEGEISDNSDTISSTSKDANGQTYSIKLNRQMTVKAGWLNSTNRITAPNVKKGEQVKLWTIGDIEEYFWEPLGRDDSLRRQEAITWGFAASSKSSDTPIELSDSNLYTFTIDTINQHITLRTSDDNNEFTRFTVQINTKDGSITLADDLGNLFQLDSKLTKITLLNKDETFITIDKKNILVSAPETIDLKSKNINLLAKESINLEAGDSINLKSSKQITLTSKELLVKMTNINMEGTTKIKGDTTINGSLKVSGTIQSKSVKTDTLTATSATFKSHGPH